MLFCAGCRSVLLPWLDRELQPGPRGAFQIHPGRMQDGPNQRGGADLSGKQLLWPWTCQELSQGTAKTPVCETPSKWSVADRKKHIIFSSFSSVKTFHLFSSLNFLFYSLLLICLLSFTCKPFAISDASGQICSGFCFTEMSVWSFSFYDKGIFWV